MTINFNNSSGSKNLNESRIQNRASNATPPADVSKVTTQQENTKTQSVAVSISPEAKMLERMESRLSRSTSFDKNKISVIKSAIEEGRYQINLDRLANKLLDSEYFADK
ncbi:MAG TPA: flagellar biosynthesis anti-sigma factor FlgM [Pseudomonadales bacterium]|nr:flagellar biosynthesis anti-sigma factor FlgM [Pseudomonadales bacterium]